MPINSATQLACTDFDQQCRWRNGGYAGTIPWSKATQKIAGWNVLIIFENTFLLEMTLFNETGTYTPPRIPYAFLYIEQDQNGTAKLLVSDPIHCQAPSGATLTFRVWASKGVKISVCVLDLDMNELECRHVSTMRSPAPSSHHFEQTKNFMASFP
jgi:hypothetical protein